MRHIDWLLLQPVSVRKRDDRFENRPWNAEEAGISGRFGYHLMADSISRVVDTAHGGEESLTDIAIADRHCERPSLAVKALKKTASKGCRNRTSSIRGL